MATFYMLIGPAGCGKSHLAEVGRIDKLWDVVVSSDAIREMLYGDESIQKDHQLVFEIAHNQIADHLEKGEDVVFDATNLVPKYRSECLEIVERYAELVVGIVYTGSLELCLARNSNRDRKVPKEVVTNMYSTLYRFYPELTEGFDCLISMETVLEGVDMSKVKEAMYEEDLEKEAEEQAMSNWRFDGNWVFESKDTAMAVATQFHDMLAGCEDYIENAIVLNVSGYMVSLTVFDDSKTDVEIANIGGTDKLPRITKLTSWASTDGNQQLCIN